MKIAAISDTHNKHESIRIPECDLLIHAGDACCRGTKDEAKDFLKWFSEQVPTACHIFVPGNHDCYFEKRPKKMKEICGRLGIHCLMNEGLEFEGVKIWGVPDTPYFMNWSFNRARNASESYLYNIPLMADYTDMIPDDTDILITHGPPYEIRDELVAVDGVTPTGRFVGCEDTLRAVKRVKPDLHFFGHVHCGHGEAHIDGTSFYNVAMCDEMYLPSNPVTEVDYSE